MGNKSDLQAQVTRFKERAELAESHNKHLQETIMGLQTLYQTQMEENRVLASQTYEVRVILAAVVAATGGMSIDPQILHRIDAGEILGIKPPHRTEEGWLVIEPLFAGTEDDPVEALVDEGDEDEQGQTDTVLSTD